jgi:hypothetical protein
MEAYQLGLEEACQGATFLCKYVSCTNPTLVNIQNIVYLLLMVLVMDWLGIFALNEHPFSYDYRTYQCINLVHAPQIFNFLNILALPRQ